MLQGRARDGKSILEAKQPWDECESASFEAKELREQVIYGPEIIKASG